MPATSIRKRSPKLLVVATSSLAAMSLLWGCVNSDSNGSDEQPPPSDPLEGRPDPLAGLGEGRDLPESTDYVIDYDGPELESSLDGSELRLTIPEAPAGSTWSFDAIEQVNGDVGVVVVKLDVPPSDSPDIADTGTTRLESTLDLDDGLRRVEIRIAIWEQGVQYFIPPEAHLAAVLTR